MLCSILPFAENLPDTANPTQWQIGLRVHLTQTVGTSTGTRLEGMFRELEEGALRIPGPPWVLRAAILINASVLCH